MTVSTPSHAASRARRIALLSATMLAGGLIQPADAALFKVVVNQVPDPLLSGLSIPASAATTGMFSGVSTWPINAITLGLLPNGKIVSYGTPVNNPGTQDGRTFDIWDPTRAGAANAHVTVQGVVGVNSFCGAQAFRFDGSLISSGGIFDNGQDKGSVILNSSATAIGAVKAQMANDRYYSTLLTLPNGKQIILGGTYPYAAGHGNPQASINNGEMKAMTPEIFDGNQWNSLFGANSRDAFGPDNSRYWYPRAWNAPNGKVFGITSDKMWYLDTNGNGSVTTMNFRDGQKNVANAVDAPNVGPGSTAVMYDSGKIIQVGGNAWTNGEGYTASSRATTVDISGANPVLKDVAPMKYGRSFANATVLPPGQVVVNGGSTHVDDAGNAAVLQTEIWNPGSGQWTVAASAAIYRGYHSTAILMQNGALLTAGGGSPGPVANQNAEIYYPPYLFTSSNGAAALAPRPQIVSLASLQMAYGQSTQFELTSQNGLSQVVLVGLSLVTHNFNSTQRRYVAQYSQSGNVVTVQTPSSANVVPPGYYQLVAVDSKGVPSPGIIVAVGNTVAAPAQATTYVASSQGGSGGTNGGGTGGSGSGGSGNGTGGTGTGGTGGGTASVLKASHSGLCLSVPAGNTADRTPVTQQACTGGNEQLWRQTSTVTGTAFVNVASVKCLDMTLDNQPVNPGAQIYQYACHGGSNQAWTPKAQGAGNALVSAYNNFCVGVYGASTQAGAGVVGWTCTGVPDQTYTGPSASGTATGQPLVSAQSGLCLAVPAGNKNDRAPVTQQTCTGAAEQMWRPTSGNGGTAYVNAASGKCLDLSLDNQPAAPGAQVYQYACTNATNQAWTPKAQGTGNSLVSVNAKLCLGVYGGTGQVGAAAVGWTCNGAADQLFTSRASKL